MIRHLSVCIALTALWLGGASHASAIDIKDGVYQISSGADLAEFSRLVAEGNGNIKGVMTRDVDMTGIGFSPIGSGDVPFSGVFDGGCNYVCATSQSTLLQRATWGFSVWFQTVRI